MMQACVQYRQHLLEHLVSLLMRRRRKKRGERKTDRAIENKERGSARKTRENTKQKHKEFHQSDDAQDARCLCLYVGSKASEEKAGALLASFQSTQLCFFKLTRTENKSNVASFICCTSLVLLFIDNEILDYTSCASFLS